MNKIGDNLKELRIKRNLSLDEVEYATGIAKPTISRYERNLSEPTITKLKTLAYFYGVTLDNLCNSDEITKTADIPDEYKKIMMEFIENHIPAEKLELFLFLLKGDQ